MASILSSAGKVGLVTMSFGYIAARLTTSVPRKMDFSAVKEAVAPDQQQKEAKNHAADAHVQCLHTALR